MLKNKIKDNHLNFFQLLMLGAAAYFAYKVYEHTQTLQDPEPRGENDADISYEDSSRLNSIKQQSQSLLEAQNYSEAIEALKEVVDARADDIEAINDLAYAYMQSGDSRNALKYYEKSLALEDNDDVTHLAYASLLKEIREYQKAKEHYKRAIAIDDTYDITYFNYANLLVEMGELEEAKAMYAKAIALNPDFTQAKFELEKLS